MIEFMDEITDAVEQFSEWVAEIAVKVTKKILILLAKAGILLTTPVWILPYKLLRDTMRDLEK